MELPTCHDQWMSEEYEPALVSLHRAQFKVAGRNPQGQNWENVYLPRLIAATRHLQGRGFDVKIVQHEYGKKDAELVDTLAKDIPDAQIIRRLNPQELKAFLGEAKIVIGSRFQSLVSALSMGVPSVALGWAHKYDLLMEDFGVPDMIHYASDRGEQLTGLIDSTLENYQQLSVKIMERKSQLASQVQSMWQNVIGELDRIK